VNTDFIPAGAPVHRRRLSRLETALVARRNVLEIIPALSYRQPMVSGEMLMRWHMLADPGGMKRVMLDNLANYPKSEIMRRMLRPAIGNSLFNAEGADWKWQRQAVAPVFTHRNVVALAPAMTATAERACQRLAANGRAEMVTQMMTATFDVICDVALSGREHFDATTFSAAITRYFQTAGRASLLDFLGFPLWFPRPGELLAATSVHTMHHMVATAIEARRQEAAGGTADDLLNHMLAARDPETGQQMTPEELVHNMQFFIVAGHETTALALAWALYLLAHAQEWQERLRAEVTAQLNGRAAGPDDLAALPLVEQVLEEAMRLYPPVGLLARAVLAKDELCGRTVQPNDIVFLPIWALHRHEMWWEKPEKFDPGRFAPENRRHLNRYQYLPFGAGPRVCVGADFAMMQARIILATLVQKFRFTPAMPAPHPVMMMTVRPEPGVFLNVIPA